MTTLSDEHGFASVIDLDSALGELSSLSWANLSNSEVIDRALKTYLLDKQKDSTNASGSILLINCYLLPPALYNHLNYLHELIEQNATKYGYERACLYGYESLYVTHSEAHLSFLGYEVVSNDLRVLNLRSPMFANIDFPVPAPSLELL